MTDLPIGFPAQKSQALLRSLLAETRARGDVAAEEAVTGRRVDVPAALGGRIAEVLDIERSLTDLDGYAQSIALAETRGDLAQDSLGRLARLADDVLAQATVAQQNGTAGGLELLSAVARDALDDAVSALNVSFAGRGVFAGDAAGVDALAPAAEFLDRSAARMTGEPTAADALARLVTAFDAPAGTFATNLYLGGIGDAPAVEARPGERIDFAVRADAPPIRDLLRGLSALGVAFDRSNGLDDGQRRGILEGAVETLRSAVAPLANLSGDLGAAQARLEDAKIENSATETLLTQRFADLGGRDPVEAAAEFKDIEAQLERLFLTTARFNQLSLANFLR